MPSYTYDDFVKAANQKGLFQEFSQADLQTAQRYPEFGMSILGLKEDIHKATTPEAKLLANEMANQLRSSYGGYTGGKYGADYISDGKIPNQIDSVLDKINGFGSFNFDQERPSYENQYAEQQQALLDAIINRPDFSWSKEDDPQWSSYKKSYLREGDRATANALGQAAAASGGRPSTAALTAATQAGDYYATQLNDIIPTLYQQAYDRYLNEYNMSLQDLNAVNTQEQLDYTKYLDQLGQFNTDRNFAFNQYLSDFDILQDKLSALQGQDSVDFDRYWNGQQLQREDAMAQQQLAQGQVDAILSAGGSPSADLVGASGYTTEYVQALQAAYQRQLAARSGSGGSSSGSRSGSSGGGDSADYDGLFAAALESGHPKSFIANNYKKYGFTSQTGLSDEYEEWALGQEEKAGRPVENSLAMNPDSFRAFGQSIAAQLAAGGENAALGNIESRWGELSESQRAQIQQLLRRYGLEYEE
ncbi:hypothetical protein [Dysosmobacter welbionis]|uniref:hypothetical protein n=1 Tax=Dysosmobacter welbionis TaxID=2093857 RepID=UPI0029424665|nr:hypothetical protein [Dysosmobacter welbionis]